MTEPFCFSPEMITTLFISYIPIQSQRKDLKIDKNTNYFMDFFREKNAPYNSKEP